MKNANRGQIRIIEALLAVLIVFSAFAVSANLPMARNVTKREDLTSIGLQSLIRLDEDGSLGKHIADRNFTALREAVSLLLPVGICFNLTIYDKQMHQINTEVIANGGFVSQETVFVEYICASQDKAFSCYVIHLLLAVAT
jgi:hypothetical protein